MVTLEDKVGLKTYLLKRSIIDGDCLRFVGTHDKNGYGRIQINYKLWEVHRLSAYIHHNLNLKDYNTFALHKVECKHKDCWSEHHIYLGSHSQNMKDAVITRTHKESRKTHCPQGHPLEGENLSIKFGSRRCKACARLRARAKYRRVHGIKQ